MTTTPDSLSPPPPTGGASGHVGDSPYPLSGMDVTPQAPQGAADHVAPFGNPFTKDNWNTEVAPAVDRHDGFMDDHRGTPKPGPFPGDYVVQDGGLP